MNNLVELHKRESIRETASLWVVRLKEGLSAEQEQEFSDWLDEHREHGIALVEIATAWDELDIIEQLSSHVTNASAQKRGDSTEWKPLALAASVIFCFIIAWTGFVDREPVDELVAEIAPPDPKLSYDTAIGEQSKVNLPDGSTSSLNTNSKIVVKFSNTERKVELLQGEALFEVRPDKTRPFVVLAGNISVRAVGTAFNVLRSENDTLEVLVSEGKVAIFSPRETGTFNGVTRKKHNEVELSAGEMVEIQGSSETVSQVDKKKMENRLAWTTGMVIFDDQPLEQVISELSRYTETTIILGDPSLASINVAGYFKAGDVDALLYALSENFGITWNEQKENLIVLRPR